MILTDLAHAVLGGVIAHWPDASVFPDIRELPTDRQYVTVGTSPVADCEQVVVTAERVFGTEGNPGLERIVNITSGVPYLRTAVLSIEILRCIPVVDAIQGNVIVPDPADIDSAAAVILTDADAVLLALIRAQKAGELGGCGEIALENWRAVGEQGGFAGGSTRVRLNMF